jgi:hypothetical protein
VWVHVFDEAEHRRCAPLFRNEDAPNEAGVALLSACSAGDTEAVTAALRKGASWRAQSLAPDTRGWRPLHFAASGGHVGVIRASNDAALEMGVGCPSVNCGSHEIHADIFV